MGAAAGGARRGNGPQKTKGRNVTKEVSSGKAALSQDWSSGLVQQVQAIDVDDPHFNQKVFRTFLSSVLAAELGTSLQNDPRFMVMVDAVQLQMVSDPELKPLIEQAVQALIHSASASL
jgi:hypothetical protein